MHRLSIAAIVSLLWTSACSHDDAPATTSSSTAATTCGSDADCQLPQKCTAGACTAVASCTPPGSPKIVAGGTAGPAQAPSACVRTVQQPGALAQKLGTHAVGEKLAFTVPAGTSSLTIVSQAVGTPADSVTYQGSSLENTVVPTSLQDPSGAILYDDTVASPADPSGQAVFYGAASPSTSAMTVPNTTSLVHEVVTQGQLPPGTWHLTVNDWAYECLTASQCTGGSSASRYDIQVITKSGSIGATGTLDVALYLVGGSRNAAAAVTDPAVARMVKTMGQLYSGAGLCLGTVTIYDVPDWARTNYGSGLNVDDHSPCGDLSQMFTLAKSGTQLNLFLVDDLVSAEQNNGTVVGVDGSIPGPSTVGGTVNSGAAVSSADLSISGCGSAMDVVGCGADEVAYIAAHEGGHWMGLYHPTELYGDAFDPLSDTATCACTACAPASAKSSCSANDPNASSPTVMDANWCTASTTCGAGDNLMFWIFGSGSKGTLTSDQALTIRSNPLVR